MRNTHVSIGKLRRDTAWFGFLHTNRNLLMVGRLYEQNSMLYYSEQLRDFSRNSQGDVIMVSTAYCGTDPGGQRMRIVDASTWRIPAMPERSATFMNPVPPAASLAPPDLHPVVAPPATGSSNSVPIVVINDRARVAVTLGDYPLPQTMIVDTGASVMNLPADLAAELLKRGQATGDGAMTVCIADGSCASRVRIWVNSVTVGPRTVEHVEAVVAPNGAEMLLPFSVITHGGRATIDTEKGLLIFG